MDKRTIKKSLRDLARQLEELQYEADRLGGESTNDKDVEEYEAYAEICERCVAEITGALEGG